MVDEKKVKTLKMKPGDYGEHQIDRVNKLLKRGFAVVVIEEDNEGNEITRYSIGN
jgi:hypothetical protein